MRISVIGAGAVGSAIAKKLADLPEVEEVLVCDTSPRALASLAAATKAGKIHSYQVSARDTDAIAPILQKSDSVVCAIGYDRQPDLARLAVASNCHYLDLGSSEANLEEFALLAPEAEAAGRWIVHGCGLAPGLVNVLCLHAVNHFEEVDAAFIRVGTVPREPKPPFDFNISWSAAKLIEDYTGKVCLIENGDTVICEPLSRVEDIAFDAPFNQLEAFCTAGGLASLPERLAGRVQTLDFKTIRRPGHADRMRFLIGLGFADEKSVDIRTHLTYRDILIRRMWQRLGGTDPDIVLMRIVVHGKVGGVERTLRYEMMQTGDSESGLNAMKYCTAVPAVVIARELAAGAVGGGGTAPPEGIMSGNQVLAALREHGLGITETWADGFVPVSNR
ncbi:MAG: lysine 6-dehydrogenase [Rhodothermales bacterium]|jgi:lysine 6-dehydrogenase